jgi:hypothetical protein
MNYLTRRKHLWILGHETTLLRSNSIWSKVVQDAKERNLLFHAHLDMHLAEAISHFRKFAIYAQSTGDILIEATINEADRRVDATIEEENIGSLPGDMQRNSDMGQDQVSSLSLPQCDQFAVNSPVGTAIDEANVEFSPSHVHSRKRPCPFCKDQLAVPEVAQAIEAQAIEATVEDNDVIIEELTQLAEGSNAMKDNKRAKKANPYEQARSARDGRFWSTEQEKLYNNVYKQKDFADNRWIDWESMKQSKEMLDVEKKCKNINLRKLMGIRNDWHEETVKQFFSTFYINPSRTSLTWMSGINKKITVTKGFCEKLLLGDPQHSSKIEDKLTHTQEVMLNNFEKDGLFSAADRLVRKTIYPRARSRDKTHKDIRVILYHILTEKPFDVVDMMFREMEKTLTDHRILIPYAPYIMLLIDHVKIVPETEKNRSHHVYNIELQKCEKRNGTGKKHGRSRTTKKAAEKN